jgi:CRISPR-associated protein Csy3
MTLKTASVLAFERKLDPSDALFSSGQWHDRDHGESWPAVTVREKSVRGTISHRFSAKDQDPAKLDDSIQAPNLQAVDVATLPNVHDTLRVRFTLRVLDRPGVPAACNSVDYQARLNAIVEHYASKVGFAELARRYAHNLANGRFLWRNRVGAEQVEVRVRYLIHDDEASLCWTFNSHHFSQRNFEEPAPAAPALRELAQVIEQGLSSQAILLDVAAYARVGDGQEVYPSQELILDRGNKKGRKSKTLYSLGSVAALHSQKIGNALRTIDTWYPDDGASPMGPIAIEPYGSVTTQGKAYRQPRMKADFYTLLSEWVLNGRPPGEENQHFVMAMLIRGGVFGEKDS